MSAVDFLSKMINFLYGALIFLILIGVLIAVYHIFWAEELTVPQQNFESVLSEIKELKKDSRFKVTIRPHNEAYGLFLYPYGNKIQGCGGRPCFCLDEIDKAMDCEVIIGAKQDCKEGVCVSKQSSAAITPDYNNPVEICNVNNELSIKPVS